MPRSKKEKREIDYKVYQYKSFKDIEPFDGDIKSLSTVEERKTFADDYLKKVISDSFIQSNDTEEFRYTGITCVYFRPKVESAEDGWKRIYRDLENIHNKLSSLSDTIYIVSCIEINCNTTKYVKKNKVKVKETEGYIATTDDTKTVLLNKNTNTLNIYGKDGKSIHANLNNNKFSKEDSDEIRSRMLERDRKRLELIDMYKREEITVDDYEDLMNKFDAENDLYKSAEPRYNDRTVMIDRFTEFRIYWNHVNDVYGRDRYYILKEPTPSELIIKTDKHLEIELKETNDGFPHLHFSLCYANIAGKPRDPLDYIDMIKSVSDFEDVKIGSSKKRANNFRYSEGAPSLMYVLKNNRHGRLINTIGAKQLRKRIVFNIVKPIDRFVKLFYNIATQKHGCTITDGLEFTIINPHTTVLTTNKNGVYENVTSQGLSLKKSSKDPFDNLINYIKTVMESQKLCFCKGKLYEKIPGSIKSYRLWEDRSTCIEDFLSQLSRGEYGLEITKNYDKLLKILKNKTYYLPTIDLSGYWVEYKDCFLSIGLGIVTKAIIPDQDCHLYYPNISYDDIINDRYGLPVKFLQIVDNSFEGLEKDKLLICLYDSLVPKLHKQRTPYFRGPGSSGKSTLVSAILSLIPESNIALINNSSQFATANLEEKSILVADEGANLHVLGKELLKIVLEGGGARMSCNQKNKDIKDTKINVNVIIASNEEMVNKELESKINFYYNYGITERDIVIPHNPFTGVQESYEELYKESATREREKIKEELDKDPLELRIKRFFFIALQKTKEGEIDNVIAEGDKILLLLMKHKFINFEVVNDEKELEDKYTQWLKKNKLLKPKLDLSII